MLESGKSRTSTARAEDGKKRLYTVKREFTYSASSNGVQPVVYVVVVVVVVVVTASTIMIATFVSSTSHGCAHGNIGSSNSTSTNTNTRGGVANLTSDRYAALLCLLNVLRFQIDCFLIDFQMNYKQLFITH